MTADMLWPPHEVKDKAKLESMVSALLRGEDLPPVVACGVQAVTGSHRIAAYQQAQRIANGFDYDGPGLGSVDVIQVPEAIYCEVAACWSGWNDRCDAMYRICSDEAIKEALADQRD